MPSRETSPGIQHRESAVQAIRRRRPIWLAALCLGLAALLQALPAPALAAEKRIALVVGNARYPNNPLANPENDARLIAGSLRKLGFEVTEKLNLGSREFRKEVIDFANRTEGQEGIALLYYAGHGVQVDGKNYLIPVDIALNDERTVKWESIDIERFLGEMGKPGRQARIVVLDACRDNPFLGKTRAIQAAGGLAEMRAYGSLIAYASAPGAAAEDGPPGTNSVYSRHLAHEMQSEGLQIEEMFRNVRVKVYRDTAERQIPWDHSSLTVKVVLNPSRSSGVGEAASAETQRRMDETLRKLEAQRAQLEDERRQLDEEKRRWAGERQPPVALAKPAASPASTTAVTSVAEPKNNDLLRKESELAEREKALKRIDDEVRREPPPAAVAKVAPTDAAPVRPTAPAPLKPASPVAVAAAAPPAAGATTPAPAARAGLCAELVMRFQVGLPLSAEETKFLQQKECKK
jgi:uncharacterized caspase-like protein